MLRITCTSGKYITQEGITTAPLTSNRSNLVRVTFTHGTKKVMRKHIEELGFAEEKVHTTKKTVNIGTLTVAEFKKCWTVRKLVGFINVAEQIETSFVTVPYDKLTESYPRTLYLQLMKKVPRRDLCEHKCEGQAFCPSPQQCFSSVHCLGCEDLCVSRILPACEHESNNRFIFEKLGKYTVKMHCTQCGPFSQLLDTNELIVHICSFLPSECKKSCKDVLCRTCTLWLLAPPDQCFGKNSFYRTSDQHLWVIKELTSKCGCALQKDQVHVRRVKRWSGTKLDKKCKCVDTTALVEEKQPYICEPVEIEKLKNEDVMTVRVLPYLEEAVLCMIKDNEPYIWLSRIGERMNTSWDVLEPWKKNKRLLKWFKKKYQSEVCPLCPLGSATLKVQCKACALWLTCENHSPEGKCKHCNVKHRKNWINESSSEYDSLDEEEPNWVRDSFQKCIVCREKSCSQMPHYKAHGILCAECLGEHRIFEVEDSLMVNNKERSDSTDIKSEESSHYNESDESSNSEEPSKENTPDWLNF
jgi:hypothetical protein